MDPSQQQQVFEVEQAFELWRSTRRGRQRIPEELWDKAISLCSFIAPTKVCKILTINYPGLRRRLRSQATGHEEGPVFLSLPDGLGKSTDHVRVELSGSTSAKMSLELPVNELQRVFPLALRILQLPLK
jgi:hypothetical protein